MTVFNTTPAPPDSALEASVIQAGTAEAQALAFTATINRITPTVAGVWDLNDTKDEVPQQTIFIPHKNPGQESVMEGDDRTLVDPVHFNPGGKYRSIVKLLINYENLPDTAFAHGTGWLIRPDLMVTAGHNVYSWRRTNGKLPGRAREIKAYIGYNGAKSISSASVEFRRAKRVVTTSQWLDSASSRPRDFALVQFSSPFTNVTPFQYIETPASGDLPLGVVGYPADLKDDQTGERGGKMYELFEQTKYDITADPDRMLAHHIDSEGGNSGGPILRGNDLVAFGTHVYGGGDVNTASVLGRYGNPVQDYIGALEVPLPSPGQINMVTVGSAYISQVDAATGPQTKEIAKLGENVVPQPSAPAAGTHPGDDSNKSEFWLFDGAEEAFRLVTGVGTALGGPIAGVVGTAVAPLIARGLNTSESDVDATMQRFMLANSTMLAAESKFQKEEGFFENLTGLVKNVGGAVIKLPFKEVMQGIGMPLAATEQLVNDVSNEIARGILLRAQSPDLYAITKPESFTDTDSNGTKLSANEEAFLQEFFNAAKAHSSARGQASRDLEAEGFFSDVKNLTYRAAKWSIDTAPTILRGVNSAAHIAVGWGPKPEGFLDSLEAFMEPATYLASLIVKKGGDMSMRAGKVFDQTSSFIHRPESAAETTPEAAAAAIVDELRRIAQALILHTVIADKYLTTQMARPVAELKAEGFFDNLFSTPGNALTTVGVGMIAGAGISTAVPPVAAVVAVPLFVGGFVTAGVGQALNGYDVRW